MINRLRLEIFKVICANKHNRTIANRLLIKLVTQSTEIVKLIM